MDSIIAILKQNWQSFEQSLPKFTLALLTFLFCLWIGRLAGRGVLQFLSRGNFSKIHKNFFRNLTEWVFIFLGFS